MVNDASSSWNGFEFQGKITIYQVLSRINELRGDKAKIGIYHFRVEGEEDFDILENNKVIELAQVKAKLSKKNVKDYLSALIKLVERDSYKRDPDNVKLTFHTGVKIVDWDRIEEKCNIELESLKNQLVTGEGADKIAELLNNIRQIDAVKSHIKDNVLVRYPITDTDENQQLTGFCALGIINSLILKKIKKYFEITGQVEKTGNLSLEKYLYNLLFFLNEHINKRHFDKTTPKEIPFLDIITILDSDLISHDDQYVYGKILDRFINLEFPNYCEFHCPLKSECIERENCYLKKMFRKISKCSLNEGYLIIRRCFPHVTIDNLNRDDYQIDSKGIHFLYKLFASNDPYDDSTLFELVDNSFRYIGEEECAVYFPTGISKVPDDEIESYTLMYRRDVCENIRGSQIPIEDVYESNGYVTGNIQHANLFEEYDIELEPSTPAVRAKRNETIISFVRKEDVCWTHGGM